MGLSYVWGDVRVREYGKVSVRFWSHGSGKRLRGDPEAQVIALHLVSCSWSNSIGIFYIPLPSLAHEVGSPLEGAMEALARVVGSGFAAYDLASEMVWIPNHAQIENGDALKSGDNRKKFFQEELEKLGNHPFAKEFWDRYGVAYQLTMPKALASPFEGPWEPLLSQSKSKARANTKHVQIVSQPELFEPKAKETPGPIAIIRRAFLDGYAARYPNAKAYPWGAKESGQAKNLLKSIPLEELLEMIGAWFAWGNARVINGGHAFGTGSDSFVWRYIELRADMDAPERRVDAAKSMHAERNANRVVGTRSQAERLAEKLSGENNGNRTDQEVGSQRAIGPGSASVADVRNFQSTIER